MMILFAYTIVFIYAGLLLWFAVGLIRIRPYVPIASDSEPFLSVVVAARNEAQNLPNLLESLARQSLPSNQFEIIIADDRSSDGTWEILQQFQHRMSGLKIIRIDETAAGWASKKWALQQGILGSKGTVIVQTDADCRPEKGWLSMIRNEFCDQDLGFLSGPAPLIDHPSEIQRAFELDSLSQDAFSGGGMSQNRVLSCTGRNMAYRRLVFDEVQGYDEIRHFPSGDDDLLLQKIASNTSWKIRYLPHPDMVVASSPPQTLKQFVRQRLRFASKGSAYYHLTTTNTLRIILPLLWVVNLAVVWSIIRFIGSASPGWLLIWIVKTTADGVLSGLHSAKLNRSFPIQTLLWVSVIHPLYVVVFGLLGSLVKVQWKDRT